MADWLRPVFGRTKSSLNITSTPTTSTFRLPADESRHVETPTSSKARPARPASRLTTFMGHATVNHGTSITERNPEMPKTPPPSQKVRPRFDCDKMVEKLKCIMMALNTLEPLPREFNFYILHFLEVYQEMREKLEKKQRVVDELRTTRAAELDEFEQLATQWARREGDYKLEIKRLEIMLSKIAGGMENVALARSNSIVHGTQRVAQIIGNDLDTIRGRHVEMEEKHYRDAKRQREEEIHAAAFRSNCKTAYDVRAEKLDEVVRSYHEHFADHAEISVFEKDDVSGIRARILPPQSVIIYEMPFECTSSSDASFNSSLSIADGHIAEDQEWSNDNGPNPISVTTRGCVGTFPKPRALQQDSAVSGPRERNDVNVSRHPSTQPDPAEEPLAELSRQHVNGQGDDVFDRSTSESSSDHPISINITRPTQDAALSLQMPSNSLITQGLSSLPRNPDFVKHATTVPLEAKEFPNPDAKHQKRFSFQPGDDSALSLPPKGAYAPEERDVSEQIAKTFKAGTVNTKVFTKEIVVAGNAIKSNSQSQPRQTMLPIRTTIDDTSFITRADSASSIVTAVRHNSGHNSASKPVSPRENVKSLASMVSKSKENNVASVRTATEAVVAASRAFNQGSSKLGLPAHLQPDIQEHRISAKKTGKGQQKTAGGKAPLNE